MKWIAGQITPERLAAFNDWRRQPTTVAGIGVVSAALTAWAQGQFTSRQMVFAIVGGLVMIALPDNANRKISAVPAGVAAVQAPFTVVSSAKDHA